MSLIQVAIAITVLTAFSAFVLDHGVMLLARGQAQNVADAAALAGVTSRVKDEPGDTDPAANGFTEKSILSSISQHKIFGGPSADIGKTWSWPCPAGVTGWCVTVNVFRDGTNSSTTLPVYFGPLLGASSQKSRATATAVAKSANSTGCLKPWMIPDQWEEHSSPANDTFDPADGDVYREWDETNPTGFSTSDWGTTVTLKPGTPSGAISPSDFFEILEATTYEESIVKCRIEAYIGMPVDILNGNRVGPTNQGVTTLTANGPVDVLVGLFSPNEFAALGRQTGNFVLHIVNFIGVRITGLQGNKVEGVIIGGIGEANGSAPTPTGTSSLVKAIQLVR